VTAPTPAPVARIAIVSGAARGIGASIARRLAADGLDVAVLDLDIAACAKTVAAVEALGRRALAVEVDVSDQASVASAMARVVGDLGAPTVLVNNAGVLHDRTLAHTTLEDWEWTIAVNLRGTFLMCKAVLPFMRAAGWGRIVNLSSTGALGGAGLSGYSAAKAGVQGLTRTLAIELGRYGVTVNAVAPGFTPTAMTAQIAERGGVSYEQMQHEMSLAVPVGRVGHPDDAAHAVSFFVDERSGFVSGQVLYVAGGPIS
jgi:3-oxoacyl-[acyl-carrier protein] reductase